jgi:HAD superfamily hydrolase (TIGR01457 family)
MKDYKGYIFDMDGVVYRGNTLIPGAVEALESLKRRGKRLVFVSNNSTRARDDYAERIREMGLPIEMDEVIPATYATARFLADNYTEKRIFVVGALGLIKELLRAELTLVDTPEKADILVTGSDPAINYQKLSQATSLLLKGKLWVTTNTDKLYPAEDRIIPGTGAVVGALQYITGRPPDVVIGKPSRHIMEQALKALGVEREDCLMVGDIIESDVLAGKNAGIDTALVLTGVTSREDVERSEIKPDYVLNSIKDLEG